jgi:hypothetical protein
MLIYNVSNWLYRRRDWRNCNIWHEITRLTPDGVCVLAWGLVAVTTFVFAKQLVLLLSHFFFLSFFFLSCFSSPDFCC